MVHYRHSTGIILFAVALYEVEGKKMTATLDLRIATPVEIDTILADLDYKRWTAFMKAVQYRQSAYKAQEGSRYSRPDPARAEKLMGYAAEQDEIAAARADEMAPYEAEFSRRGGWTRAFLVVTSGTGHVHSSQRCHTCYPTTQFHWVTKLSGHDEAEIVEAAGERACTICYPSAPAYVLNRPTALFTKDEEAKQAAREEREAKKAAAQAASIIDPVTGKVLWSSPVTGRAHGLAVANGCLFVSTDRGTIHCFRVAAGG